MIRHRRAPDARTRSGPGQRAGRRFPGRRIFRSGADRAHGRCRGSLPRRTRGKISSVEIFAGGSLCRRRGGALCAVCDGGPRSFKLAASRSVMSLQALRTAAACSPPRPVKRRAAVPVT